MAKRVFVIGLVIVAVFCCLTTIVSAQDYRDSELAINMAGVNSSRLAIDMSGVGDSRLALAYWRMLPSAPADFTITKTGDNSIEITWEMGGLATEILIKMSTNGYPATVVDGTEAYSGNGTSVEIFGLDLDKTTYYYRAWSWNSHGYSVDYAQDHIGGTVVVLITLSLLALGLTIVMFATRSSLLGFPAGMFWAILSGYSYQQSATTGDLDYILFFASMGLAIFSFLAAYTLRKRDLAGPDADKGQYIDEDANTKETNL